MTVVQLKIALVIGIIQRKFGYGNSFKMVAKFQNGNLHLLPNLRI